MDELQLIWRCILANRNGKVAGFKLANGTIAVYIEGTNHHNLNADQVMVKFPDIVIVN